MNKDLEMLHRLCEIITDKLAECERNLSAAKDMSVSDIKIINELTHALKSVKTTIAMMEAQEEEGGMSRRYYPMSYEGGMSGRRMSRDGGSYDNGGGSYGGSYDGSYDGGMSNRRGRSPSTGRYVSRDGGYSGHDSLEDIMEDIRDMPEGEKKRLKQMLERM